MNHLRESLSQYWLNIQASLFPWLQEELGELTEKQQQLVTTLELIRIEEHLSNGYGSVGRPTLDRVAIARAFVAKMIFNLSTTAALIDRVRSDIRIRRICGWERLKNVPSEASFSRAFAEFSEHGLPQHIHEALIVATHQDRIVGHISRDATAIVAREKPCITKSDNNESPQEKKKRGRPKKGEERKPDPTRLQKQATMSLEEMLDDLPKDCSVGTKKNSKGYKESWIGYKLHIDAADGQIPVSCILTSASVHDSQVAIPLATQTSQRTTNLYDLMDAAYDVDAIKAHSESLGHVPIIDINPRRNQKLKAELADEARRQHRLGFSHPTDQRYNERSTVERVNGRLKDEFGGRMVRVRGHAKVACHVMFGIVALTADQLMKLVT
jgi:hypothetical protein